MGLDVADERNDCPDPYDRDKLLPLLKAQTGGVIFSPFTRRGFHLESEVHVEHIVAAKQAHVSGLCDEEDRATRPLFASDSFNLALAGKGVNQAKAECDAASWQPPENRCWFAKRVVDVRRKYGLTIDRAERDALADILAGCGPDEFVMDQRVQTEVHALSLWDENGNGQITCGELEAAGVATPITPSHPAYPFVTGRGCDSRTCTN